MDKELDGEIHFDGLSCLSIYLSICPSVCLFVCPCPLVCLAACPSGHLLVSLSVSQVVLQVSHRSLLLTVTGDCSCLVSLNLQFLAAARGDKRTDK